MTLIQELDFVAFPRRTPRARSFYRDVLGMRPDEHAEDEQWAGSTCRPSRVRIPPPPFEQEFSAFRSGSCSPELAAGATLGNR